MSMKVGVLTPSYHKKAYTTIQIQDSKNSLAHYF